MDKKSPLCPAIWLSGFFGLGTLVHLIRLIFQVPVVIGTWGVPLTLSAIAFVVFGALSAGLLYVGCKRPCCAAGAGGKETA